VHIEIVDVLLVDWLVLLCGKANKAFVVDVEAERVTTCHKCVDSHIELQTFIEERIVDVGLDHALPIPLDFSDIPIEVPASDCDKKIPLPWQLASGLTIKVFCFPFLRLSP
jgi:hypothetical protein